MAIPKLSVAITTYAHEAFIGPCLDSVLAQERDFPMEIVVGDDCSPDGTGQVVADYANRHPEVVRVLRRGANLGYPANFRDVLRQCRGEYTAVFDGDDLMLPGKLRDQVAFLDRNPDHVLVGHLMRAFDSATGRTVRWVRPPRRRPFYTLRDQIRWGSFLANSSKVFRTSALPETWLDLPVRVVADLPLSIGLAERGRVGYLPRHMADYRVHGTSLMKSSRAWDHVHDRDVIIGEIESRFGDRFEVEVRAQRAYRDLLRGIALDGERRFPEALEAYANALRNGGPLYGIGLWLRFFRAAFRRFGPG